MDNDSNEASILTKNRSLSHMLPCKYTLPKIGQFVNCSVTLSIHIHEQTTLFKQTTLMFTFEAVCQSIINQRE